MHERTTETTIPTCQIRASDPWIGAGPRLKLRKNKGCHDNKKNNNNFRTFNSHIKKYKK